MSTLLYTASPIRRSGNYKPSIWNDEYVQSLDSIFKGSKYLKPVENLKDGVKVMLQHEAAHGNTLDQLELIDILQRLGISYHFDNEIETILSSIYTSTTSNHNQLSEDLYIVALKFRLLRQQRHYIPQEVFECFMESGKFKVSQSENTKAILCLYEASYLAMEDETILDTAQEFAIFHLNESLKLKNLDEHLSEQVRHALELPLHWRVQRLEARWFIGIYEKMPNANASLLELAKLDFNLVQAQYQDELKHMSTWYTCSCMSKTFSFARDRIVELFLWALGYTSDPQFSYCRKVSTTVGALQTIVDDMYDIYGTLDELQIFTDIIESWDINALERLPDNMKICFLAIFNSINQMGYEVLQQRGFNIIPYLRKEDEMKRGDVPKAIQCYIQETGRSEEDARKHISKIIEISWKKMNKVILMDGFITKDFSKNAMNLARIAQYMYQHGDGFGVPDGETKDRIIELLVKPITLNENSYI